MGSRHSMNIMVSSAYLRTSLIDSSLSSFFHQNQQYLRQTVHSLSPMTSFPLTSELMQRYKSSNNYKVKLQPAALHGSMADFCKPKHVAPESIIERTRHAHPQQPGLQTTFHLTFLPVMFGTSSIQKQNQTPLPHNNTMTVQKQMLLTVRNGRAHNKVVCASMLCF